MTPQQALDILKNIFKNTPDFSCKKNPENISTEDTLRKDLGLDSISHTSLFYELQDMYPDLHEEEGAQWKKVSDILESLCKQ